MYSSDFNNQRVLYRSDLFDRQRFIQTSLGHVGVNFLVPSFSETKGDHINHEYKEALTLFATRTRCSLAQLVRMYRHQTPSDNRPNKALGCSRPCNTLDFPSRPILEIYN